MLSICQSWKAKFIFLTDLLKSNILDTKGFYELDTLHGKRKWTLSPVAPVLSDPKTCGFLRKVLNLRYSGFQEN